MKTHHSAGDNAHLYFSHDENKSDEEELTEIISMLKEAGCVINDPVMAPDCDYFICSINGIPFTLIYSLDLNYGTFICCFDGQGMKQIEEIFA